MRKMKISLLGKRDCPAFQMSRDMLLGKGHGIVSHNAIPDLAVAPLLTEILSEDMMSAPLFGTLIFHPSPLPYGRGADAIKYAYARGEFVTAATWFWANAGKVDSGDICEQEIIKIDYSMTPRQFYEAHVIPALLRTLERAVDGVASGNGRRIPQLEEYATFDYKLRRD
jgi:methionyl-tRNA formyltransferase